MSSTPDFNSSKPPKLFSSYSASDMPNLSLLVYTLLSSLPHLIFLTYRTWAVLFDVCLTYCKIKFWFQLSYFHLYTFLKSHVSYLNVRCTSCGPAQCLNRLILHPTALTIPGPCLCPGEAVEDGPDPWALEPMWETQKDWLNPDSCGLLGSEPAGGTSLSLSVPLLFAIWLPFKYKEIPFKISHHSCRCKVLSHCRLDSHFSDD